MSKNLVIVESPAKARTLSKILGRSYTIKASLGHIRDLPRSRLGVDVEKDFEPKYVVPKDKSKLVTELKQAVKDATTVWLATDPDREGEAIAWHIAEVTQTDHRPFRRVVFHEITEDAIKRAFEDPHSINMKLVDAQQARRILDRLVGYKISPLLWKKIRRGLSAGRVQSVAVRIVIDREREIQAFVAVEYWVIEAELAKKGVKASFRALFVGLADGKKIEVHTKEESDNLLAALEKASYSVAKVATRKVTRQPSPPFITSTLQQEAWRKLHFTAKQTMAIAQQLYEGLTIGDEGSVGLITYMRTDSTHIAPEALAETRSYINHKYGDDYLPPRYRVFTRQVKGAQEAHEAIRPTNVNREPTVIKQYLTVSQNRLYDLIWKRMVASQMSAAQFDNTTADIEASDEKKYLLRSASMDLKFPGFITLYSESRDEEEEEKKNPLPELNKGDALNLIKLDSEQKFTQPPPRYTEATLIKALEANGIGRPSTYAPTLSTIQDREYVAKEKGAFKPTEMGFLVNDLLSQNFPDIVDIQFTARMEEELDEIVNKDRDWVSIVKEFYSPLEKDLEKANVNIEKVKVPDELTGEACPKCGKPLAVKVGRFGKFVACSGYPECRYTQSFQVKTGVKCPECGTGELVQRVSKKKRTFYGCNRYPECKFATNLKPLPEKCPQCGGMMTAYRGKTTKCIKCNYKGKMAETGAEAKVAGKA